MKLKSLCHISVIVYATRTLPAMVGRRDGEEVMVAASAGEVQGEGERNFPIIPLVSRYIGFPGP